MDMVSKLSGADLSFSPKCLLYLEHCGRRFLVTFVAIIIFMSTSNCSLP